jgi:para-nitrobenzyl esterase
VWTPANSTAERLPVFFWIHGGGFSSGSASVAIYDGAALAARGIVVVSINYRLSSLGFLAHPELTSESRVSSSGNYAIQDMIAALAWVRDNITAFGGDPNQVTIAGQSAGAGAVHSLILAPEAKGLFVRAIAQSGSGARRSSPSLAAAEATGVEFMAATGATSLAELRALPPEDLLAVDLTGMRFGPIIDGAVVPMSLADAQESGSYNDTPILTGYTADEGSSWSDQYGRATVAEHEANIEKTYGKLKDRFLKLYAASDDAAAGEMSKSLERDRTAALMYRWAADRLKTSKNPIYCYWYTHPEPGPESARWGAFHAAELAYVFDTLDKSTNRPFTDQDRAIARTMADYWSNFVKTGDPNGAGLEEWPALDVTSKRIMELGDAFRARKILSPMKLELFEAYANGDS